jgi:UDP-glucose 4-epimerase
MLNQLRFGRALDNRKLKATGYRYRYTTRETVLKLREHQRVAPLLRRSGEPYRYEEEVEEFLRYSPSVRPLERDAGRRLVNVPAGQGGAAPAEGTQVSAYAELQDEEVVALLPSLDGEGLHELREHERSNAGRIGVLEAIDDILERRR